MSRARATCVELARLLDCAPEQVLPFSTGVIMETLPHERIEAGLPAALAAARADGWADAAEAIMTTDTVPKAASRRFRSAARRSRDRHQQGRRHDPAEHGDDARLRRLRCGD